MTGEREAMEGGKRGNRHTPHIWSFNSSVMVALMHETRCEGVVLRGRKGKGNGPQSEFCLLHFPSPPQKKMKFLVSVTGHLG